MHAKREYPAVTEAERAREREREGNKRGKKTIRANKRKTKVQLKMNEERSNVGKTEFSNLTSNDHTDGQIFKFQFISFHDITGEA